MKVFILAKQNVPQNESATFTDRALHLEKDL